MFSLEAKLFRLDDNDGILNVRESHSEVHAIGTLRPEGLGHAAVNRRSKGECDGALRWSMIATALDRSSTGVGGRGPERRADAVNHSHGHAVVLGYLTGKLLLKVSGWRQDGDWRTDECDTERHETIWVVVGAGRPCSTSSC